jgi:hypothetical protein
MSTPSSSLLPVFCRCRLNYSTSKTKGWLGNHHLDTSHDLLCFFRLVNETLQFSKLYARLRKATEFFCCQVDSLELEIMSQKFISMHYVDKFKKASLVSVPAS